MRKDAWKGAPVSAVFENLLPDNLSVRQRVAEKTGAAGSDAWSLLEEIGRDCIGAMQFLHEDSNQSQDRSLRAEEITDGEIEKLLAGLARAPLGMEADEEFRISVAGAQEKTALLRLDGKWLRPLGITPTTHLLKPQLGEIPTASGVIDMTASVDNEHYCLTLLQEFGLEVASTSIETFGERRVLVVERFDRLWRDDGSIIRRPQEDCCQALGIPPARKYESEGGPSAISILKLLQGADDPIRDQMAFFKCQILFWMIGATDGHGKNFSIYLDPGGRFAMTPIYDVLSAQPAFDEKQIPNNRYKVAMAVGDNRKYRIQEISGRHFMQTGKQAGLSEKLMRDTFSEVLDRHAEALERAAERMPPDFHGPIHESVSRAVRANVPLLQAGLTDA